MSGGSLLVSVPHDYIGEMKTFLKKLEANEYKGLVEDWGLTNSSLEEVFIRLTDKKHVTD